MLGAVETFLSAVPGAGIFTGNDYGMMHAYPWIFWIIRVALVLLSKNSGVGMMEGQIFRRGIVKFVCIGGVGGRDVRVYGAFDNQDLWGFL